MEKIENYDMLGIMVDVMYSTTTHNNKTFPRVKEVFHKQIKITQIINHHVIENIESEIYKKLNKITQGL
jgi:hypothetical protein